MSFSPNRPPCGLNDGSSLNWEIEIYDTKYYKENVVDPSEGSKTTISEGGEQIQEKKKQGYHLS